MVTKLSIQTLYYFNNSEEARVLEQIADIKKDPLWLAAGEAEAVFSGEKYGYYNKLVSLNSYWLSDNWREFYQKASDFMAARGNRKYKPGVKRRIERYVRGQIGELKNIARALTIIAGRRGMNEEKREELFGRAFSKFDALLAELVNLSPEVVTEILIDLMINKNIRSYSSTASTIYFLLKKYGLKLSFEQRIRLQVYIQSSDVIDDTLNVLYRPSADQELINKTFLWLRTKLFKDRDPLVRLRAIEVFDALTVYNKTGDIKEEVQAGVEALKTLLNDRNLDVKRKAIKAYGALSFQLSPEEVQKAASKIRGFFKERDVQYAAVCAYSYLEPKIGLDEAGKGVVACRELFENDADSTINFSFIADAATSVHNRLISKLNPDLIQKEVEALRPLLRNNNDWVRFFATNSLFCLARRLSSKQAEREGQVYRERFGDEVPYVRKYALKAYHLVADKLSPEESQKGAEACRKLFDDKFYKVRRQALITYRDLVPKLTNTEEIQKAAEACRKLFNDSKYAIKYEAIRTYRALISKLKPEEVQKGAEACRNIFKEDGDVGRSAFELYRDLTPKLNADELLKGAETCRELFKMTDIDFTEITRTYDTIVVRLFRKWRSKELSEEKLKEEIVKIRTSYRFANDDCKDILRWAYVHLLEYLSDSSVQKEAEALRNLITNGVPNETYFAVRNYLALVSRLNDKELQKGTETCKDLMNDKDREDVNFSRIECEWIINKWIIREKIKQQKRDD